MTHANTVVETNWSHSFSNFAADIKLAHSLFAMPFAASAFVVGSLALPSWSQIGLLVLCMVGARSFAMGINRLLDADIDRENPRTMMRMIPAGKMARYEAALWTSMSAVLLVACAFALNSIAGWLSLPLLGLLALYSQMKKLTWLTHWYLGACLGFAPWGVEIALTGTVSTPVFWLGVAIMFWTAGFDILYALQDMRFDREHGLKSVPARIGPYGALLVSRFCFGTMVTLLLLIGEMIYAGAFYYTGVAIVAAVLLFEHYIVSDARFDGHSKYIGAAFFNANAAVSVIYFSFLTIDWWVQA